MASMKNTSASTGLHRMSLNSLARSGTCAPRNQSSKGNTKTRTATSPQKVFKTSKLQACVTPSISHPTAHFGLHLTVPHYTHIDQNLYCFRLRVGTSRCHILRKQSCHCHGDSSIPALMGWWPTQAKGGLKWAAVHFFAQKIMLILKTKDLRDSSCKQRT